MIRITNKTYKNKLNKNDKPYLLGFGGQLIEFTCDIECYIEAVGEEGFPIYFKDNKIYSDSPLFNEFFVGANIAVSGTTSNNGNYTITDKDENGYEIYVNSTLTTEESETAKINVSDDPKSIIYKYNLIENEEEFNNIDKLNNNELIAFSDNIYCLETSVWISLSQKNQPSLYNNIYIIGNGVDNYHYKFKLKHIFLTYPPIDKLAEYFTGEASFRHAFEVNLKTDIYNPNDIGYNIRIDNILGDVGGVDESYNGFPPKYILNTNNEEVNLEQTSDTQHVSITVDGQFNPYDSAIGIGIIVTNLDENENERVDGYAYALKTATGAGDEIIHSNIVISNISALFYLNNANISFDLNLSILKNLGYVNNNTKYYLYIFASNTSLTTPNATCLLVKAGNFKYINPYKNIVVKSTIYQFNDTSQAYPTEIISAFPGDLVQTKTSYKVYINDLDLISNQTISSVGVEILAKTKTGYVVIDKFSIDLSKYYVGAGKILIPGSVISIDNGLKAGYSNIYKYNKFYLKNTVINNYYEYELVYNFINRWEYWEKLNNIIYGCDNNKYYNIANKIGEFGNSISLRAYIVVNNTIIYGDVHPFRQFDFEQNFLYSTKKIDLYYNGNPVNHLIKGSVEQIRVEFEKKVIIPDKDSICVVVWLEKYENGGNTSRYLISNKYNTFDDGNNPLSGMAVSYEDIDNKTKITAVCSLDTNLLSDGCYSIYARVYEGYPRTDAIMSGNKFVGVVPPSGGENVLLKLLR